MKEMHAPVLVQQVIMRVQTCLQANSPVLKHMTLTLQSAVNSFLLFHVMLPLQFK